MKQILILFSALLLLAGCASSPKSYKNFESDKHLLISTTARSDDFSVQTFPSAGPQGNFALNYTLTNHNSQRRALQVNLIVMDASGKTIGQTPPTMEFFLPEVPVSKQLRVLVPFDSVADYRLQVVEPARIPNALKSKYYPQ